MDAKIQYIRMLVCREALCQFELLSSDKETPEIQNLDYCINGVVLQFPSVNSLSKPKRKMRRRTKKMRGQKGRRYIVRLIVLNEYQVSFLGETLADKIYVTELNVNILNSMHNIWSRQAYFQRFDYKSISFKKAVNIFKPTEIAEYIYKGVVEPSYKRPTR